MLKRRILKKDDFKKCKFFQIDTSVFYPLDNKKGCPYGSYCKTLEVAKEWIVVSLFVDLEDTQSLAVMHVHISNENPVIDTIEGYIYRWMSNIEFCSFNIADVYHKKILFQFEDVVSDYIGSYMECSGLDILLCCRSSKGAGAGGMINVERTFYIQKLLNNIASFTAPDLNDNDKKIYGETQLGIVRSSGLIESLVSGRSIPTIYRYLCDQDDHINRLVRFSIVISPDFMNRSAIRIHILDSIFIYYHIQHHTELYPYIYSMIKNQTIHPLPFIEELRAIPGGIDFMEAKQRWDDRFAY